MVSSCKLKIQISYRNLPEIDRAGQFPLLNPVFDFTYRNPNHALHLYNYRARIRVDSQEFTVNPGDLTCIQSGSVYSIATDEPGKHWCIHFRDDPAEEDSSIEIDRYFKLGVNSLYYREQMQHISRLCGGNEAESSSVTVNLEARFRLKSLLLGLHNLTNSPHEPLARRGNFSWDELLEWIDENLNKPISIADLAGKINLAPGTVAKKFKDSRGVTFGRYVLSRRIARARSLLATTTMTISEVGTAVGISDPQYFNKQFRKVTGVSPSRYRAENREYFAGGSQELALKDGEWRD